MDKALAFLLMIGIIIGVGLFRGLLLWALWNWFGYTCVNLAMPALHAQSIDGWAAFGLGYIGSAFTAQYNPSSDKK